MKTGPQCHDNFYGIDFFHRKDHIYLLRPLEHFSSISLSRSTNQHDSGDSFWLVDASFWDCRNDETEVTGLLRPDCLRLLFVSYENYQRCLEKKRENRDAGDSFSSFFSLGKWSHSNPQTCSTVWVKESRKLFFRPNHYERKEKNFFSRVALKFLTKEKRLWSLMMTPLFSVLIFLPSDCDKQYHSIPDTVFSEYEIKRQQWMRSRTLGEHFLDVFYCERNFFLS